MKQDLTKVTSTQLEVDRLRLDEMVMQQPSLFYQAAIQYSQALALRDGEKDNLTRVKAERGHALRAYFAEANMKCTETMLGEELMSDEVVVTVTKIFREAEAEAESAQALKEAFMQRSYALKDLVQLHCNEYRMTSSAGAEAMTTKQDQARRTQLVEKVRRVRSAQ